MYLEDQGQLKRPLKHERFNIGCQATSQLTPFEMRDFRGWIPPWSHPANWGSEAHILNPSTHPAADFGTW